MQTYDLIIVGGGAAGMLCAIEAKKLAMNKVLLIEKDNELGGALSLGNYNISNELKITGKYYKKYLIEEFEKFDMTQYNEVVFCGFGEPTERFDALKEVAAFVKEKYNKPIRINTNGAGSLINGRDIAPELKGLVDTVSVSLNHPEKEEYLKLVRSKFGEESFDAMLSFAKECTKYVPHVVMTTVDTPLSHKHEAQCQNICPEIGAAYRIRPWED